MNEVIKNTQEHLKQNHVKIEDILAEKDRLIGRLYSELVQRSKIIMVLNSKLEAAKQQQK